MNQNNTKVNNIYVGAVGAEMVQERGNTKTLSDLGKEKKKRCSQSKFWCFTLNNYNQKDMDQMGHDFDLFQCDAIVGKEVGESGTAHLQGYVEFKTRVRPLERLGNWASKGHWERRKGSKEQNVDYCSKDGDYMIYGKIVVSEVLAKITYEDLRPEQRRIADMFRENEDPKWGRKIYWFWEAKGNWGKSVLATYLCDQKGAIEVSGKASDAKCGIATYVKENKRGPPIVIMDVPRTRGADYISYEAIESIKNGRFFSSKYESGMCRFNRPHVICFANEPPRVERMSRDRWVIERLRPVVNEENLDEWLEEQVNERLLTQMLGDGILLDC